MSAVMSERQERPLTDVVYEDFEDHPVVEVAYEVRGIEGGLKEPAKFSPRKFAVGEEGYLVLKIKHRGPRHEPIPKSEDPDELRRVQILDVLSGTFVDEATVLDAIKQQDEINQEGRRLAREAEGIHELDLGAGGGAADGEEADEFVYARNHAMGSHADEAVPGCPVCAKEGRLEVEPDEPEPEDAPSLAEPDAPADGEEGSVTPMKGRGRKRDAAEA